MIRIGVRPTQQELIDKILNLYGQYEAANDRFLKLCEKTTEVYNRALRNPSETDEFESALSEKHLARLEKKRRATDFQGEILAYWVGRYSLRELSKKFYEDTSKQNDFINIVEKECNKFIDSLNQSSRQSTG